MISNSNSHLFEIRAFVWGTPRLPGRQLSNKAQPKQCLEASPVFSIFVWSADIPFQPTRFWTFRNFFKNLKQNFSTTLAFFKNFKKKYSKKFWFYEKENQQLVNPNERPVRSNFHKYMYTSGG